MNRHTFVVQVYSEGISTLENLGTEERIRITELAAVGPQIQRWLECLPKAGSDAGNGPGPNVR
jgi:hypothetical protein